MKKTALFLGLVLALTACNKNDNASGASSDTTATSQPATPTQSAPVSTPERKAEHYSAGTDATMPPFIFKDEQGQITGFDVEVLQAVADDQNFSFELIPEKQRSVLFDELKNNKYQILVANLGINPERLEKSEMSKPYVWAPNVIMGRAGGKAQTLAEIGEGRVGVQESSYSHDVLKKAGVKNIVPAGSLYSAYVALVRGEVDYVVGDAGALNHHHLSNAQADKTPVYTSVYDKSEDVAVGFAVQKGNTALIDKINAGLANIRANGKYDQIYKKWFGEDQSLQVPQDRL